MRLMTRARVVDAYECSSPPRRRSLAPDQPVRDKRVVGHMTAFWLLTAFLAFDGLFWNVARSSRDELSQGVA